MTLVWRFLPDVVAGQPDTTLHELVDDPYSKCRTTLSLDDQQVLCEKWDKWILTDAFKCGESLLPGVIERCPQSDHRDVEILAPDNDAIVNRVLMLYIAEYQYALNNWLKAFQVTDQSSVTEEQWQLWERTAERNKLFLARSVEKNGACYQKFAMDSPGRWGGHPENELEYFDLLAPAAESTFSRRIYDEIWAFPVRSSHFSTYLANVDPVRTIQELGGATVGFEMNGQLRVTDTLFTGDSKHAIPIVDAFEVLRLISETHPVLASKHAEKILSFVHTHALHFAGSQEALYDILVRYRALMIISDVGGHADLPLTRQLGIDPPTSTRDMPEWTMLPKNISIANLSAEVAVRLDSR